MAKSEPKNAPMASAPFVYNDKGEVMWNQMWDNFCVLAKEGGPPHRDTLLKGKGIDKTKIATPEYEYIIDQTMRGLSMVTHYTAQFRENGCIEMWLKSPNQAKWFADIINSENVECKIKGRSIFLPLNYDFTLEKEIKNVVTVVAKAEHYWKNHRTTFSKLVIHLFGKDIQNFEYEKE